LNRKAAAYWIPAYAGDDGRVALHYFYVIASEAKQSITPPTDESIGSSPRLAQPLRIVAGNDVERARQHSGDVDD
jgi:hypothetical protein